MPPRTSTPRTSTPQSRTHLSPLLNLLSITLTFTTVPRRVWGKPRHTHAMLMSIHSTSQLTGPFHVQLLSPLIIAHRNSASSTKMVALGTIMR